ncbi:MAG: hypothetical protein HY822_02405 [Acidobacteria bacterium]|nr:hypothetical protein [Acidobacteriota bacterium]
MLLNSNITKPVSLITAGVFLYTACQPANAAAPQNVNLQFQANVQLKFKKLGAKNVMTAVKINGAVFPVTMRNGQATVSAKLRDVAEAAPALREQLDKKILSMAGVRIRELAAAGKSGVSSGESVEAVRERLAGQTEKAPADFGAAYNQTLDQTISLGIFKPPPVVDEENSAPAEDEEDSFWVILGLIVLAVVATVVPIIALMAALSLGATAAMTVAAVTAATLLSVGGTMAFELIFDQIKHTQMSGFVKDLFKGI